MDRGRPGRSSPILAVLGLGAQYLKNVTAKQYPSRRQRARQLTVAGRQPDAVIDELLARCCVPAPGTAVDCAFSGGADSTALVVLAAAAGCHVTAVHVDHGLRASSADEAEHARRLAATLGGGLPARSASRSPTGRTWRPGPAHARSAALPAGVLTGHTADDRAETMLINLLRGTGLDGLGAHGARTGATAARPAPPRDPRAVRRPRADPGRGPDERRPPVRAQPRPPRAAPADGRRSPAATSSRCSCARPRSSPTTWRSPTPTPATSIRPTPSALAAAAPALARRALRRWLASGGYPPDAATVDPGAAPSPAASTGPARSPAAAGSNVTPSGYAS